MPYDIDAVRHRVKVLRLAFSRDRETARAFARRLGFEETAWNNYEKSQRLALDAGIRIVEELDGPTLDWLYLGDKSTLRFPVREKIDQAEASLSSAAPINLSEGLVARAGSTKSSSISRAKSKTRRA